MRCGSCQKFVSFDTEVEPEEQAFDVTEDGTVDAEYRRVLTCADCGDELKETTLTLEAQVEPTGEEPKEPCKDDEHAWEQDGDPDVEATMRVQDKDRHGKQIKSARYMTTFYGVRISGDAKCSKCGQAGHYQAEDEAAASSFDELG